MPNIDETEDLRRGLVTAINNSPKTRQELEEEYGEVYSTDELRSNFKVHAFMAPFVVVTEYTDHPTLKPAKGTLMFQDRPRLYFNFKKD